LFSLIFLPLLRTFSTSFIILFSYMKTKYIHYIHLPSPSLLILPLLLVPTPGKDLFYHPVLHFFKCVLIVQRGFAMIFHTCIYHALIKLSPYICTAPLLFSSLQCIALYNLHT
jgi:hypothetical protein